MSDIQSNEPSSTEPLPVVEAGSAEEGKPIESGTPAVSTPSPVVPTAPVSDATVIASPTVDAGNVAAAAVAGVLAAGPVVVAGGSTFEQRVEERFLALEAALMKFPASIATVMARGSQEPADFAKSVLAHLFGKQ